MPQRLVLSLLIAWLAWVPMLSAQQLQMQGPPGSGFHGMAPGASYPGSAAPTYYQRQPTLSEQFAPGSRESEVYLDSAFDLAVTELAHRTWFRTEYLWMNYRAPSSKFIGATPLVLPPAVFDPNASFPAIDRVTGVRVFQQGRVVSLERADYRDNNGLRFTMGIPTELFTAELSGFAMGQSVSNLAFPATIDVNSVLGSTTIPAIPLTRNGLPSRLDFILFDGGMNIRNRSNLQGTDVKLVFGAITPNQPVEFSPLIGFNYLHYANNMTISGSDSGTNTEHLIDSRSNNNIFGPEFGLRMEARSKWCTLGVEPKITVGINRIGDKLKTHQIFTSGFALDPVTGLPTTTPAEPDQGDKDGVTRFSPIAELNSYAHFRLGENLKFTIGYQLMATTNISQSNQNIVWDSSSIITNPPQIRLTRNRENFWMQGINVGLQWQF